MDVEILEKCTDIICMGTVPGYELIFTAICTLVGSFWAIYKAVKR